MAGLESRNFCIEETAHEANVADEVEELVTADLVREMKGQVVKVAALADLQRRLVQEIRSGSTGFSTTTMALSTSPPLIRLFLKRNSTSWKKTKVRQGAISRA